MGRKVNPIGFRLGEVAQYNALWFARKKEYKNFLCMDLLIRAYIDKHFYDAGVDEVVISRKSGLVVIVIYSSRPGIIIGRDGNELKKTNQILSKMIKSPVEFNIVEVKKVETNASLIAKNIARQLEKRGSSFRRVIKKAVQNCLKAGGQGIMVLCSGRLNGAEIARVESSKGGKLPLSTLRINIDYALCEAKTIYGIIGVKVFVCLGN
ncbi:MAG: 30S ribosomal protein S3 [Candidatus Mesenet longicola]|uniref:Small ribosomal subunit protein uS3 n=1 Tax=Candidatus Mesenet longicola TaxID=1892558 RepID=A0A8J3HVP5_9RICK|nr:MAG: 30S ribosomal protein S3 [Candidatus Mesenet longicola]GHM59156.1 MAG: 30S ribosomal protein S3 [Candidatus Mesenet longicola]